MLPRAIGKRSVCVFFSFRFCRACGRIAPCRDLFQLFDSTVHQTSPPPSTSYQCRGVGMLATIWHAGMVYEQIRNRICMGMGLFGRCEKRGKRYKALDRTSPVTHTNTHTHDQYGKVSSQRRGRARASRSSSAEPQAGLASMRCYNQNLRSIIIECDYRVCPLAIVYVRTVCSA